MTTMQWMRFLVVVMGVTWFEFTEVAAHMCFFGQEPDPSEFMKLRWVMPAKLKQRCECTSIMPGGLNTYTPERDFTPFYTDHPLFTDFQQEIDEYFNCTDCKTSCINSGWLDDETCQCVCEQNWSGRDCSNCEVDCDTQHFLAHDVCQCVKLAANTGHKPVVDCQAYNHAGNKVSGVYTIYPQSDMYPDGFKVFCHMGDHNGWIVIQRRKDGSENFNRNWREYKDGFGSLSKEFWLGNEKLHHLTGEGKWAIHVTLRDTHDTGGNIVIKPFSIMSSSNNYIMSIGNESVSFDGYNIGSQPLQSANGQQFSTYDRDNDKDPNSNCAELLQGGWWFNRCTGGNPPSDTPVESNLNGEYSHPVNYSSQDYHGIRWNTWDGHQIVYSQMRIIRCTENIQHKGFYC